MYLCERFPSSHRISLSMDHAFWYKPFSNRASIIRTNQTQLLFVLQTLHFKDGTKYLSCSGQAKLIVHMWEKFLISMFRVCEYKLFWFVCLFPMSEPDRGFAALRKWQRCGKHICAYRSFKDLGMK